MHLLELSCLVRIESSGLCRKRRRSVPFPSVIAFIMAVDRPEASNPESWGRWDGRFLQIGNPEPRGKTIGDLATARFGDAVQSERQLVLCLDVFQGSSPGKSMIYLNVVLTVKNANDVAEIESLLAEQGRLSRAEPGCVRFEVYHSQNEPQVFILNEHWADQAAVDAHRKAAAYTTIYQPKVLPKVDRIPHPSKLIS